MATISSKQGKYWSVSEPQPTKISALPEITVLNPTDYVLVNHRGTDGITRTARTRLDKLGGQLGGVNQAVRDLLDAALATSTETLASALAAEAALRLQLSLDLSTAESDNAVLLSALREMFGAHASAFQEQVTGILAEFRNSEAIIGQQQTVLTSETEALSRIINTLQSTISDGVTSLSSSILQEQIARSDSTSSQASLISSLRASLESQGNTLLASISSEQTARVLADSVQASLINVLNVSVGNNSATISEHAGAIATLDGQVEASWGVTIDTDSNGQHRVTGIQLVNGANGQTGFFVQADLFQVVDPTNPTEAIKPFTVLTSPVQRIVFGAPQQSHNYVPGVSGYLIDNSSGDAEFHRIIVRDTIVYVGLTSPTISPSSRNFVSSVLVTMTAPSLPPGDSTAAGSYANPSEYTISVYYKTDGQEPTLEAPGTLWPDLTSPGATSSQTFSTDTTIRAAAFLTRISDGVFVLKSASTLGIYTLDTPSAANCTINAGGVQGNSALGQIHMNRTVNVTGLSGTGQLGIAIARPKCATATFTPNTRVGIYPSLSQNITVSAPTSTAGTYIFVTKDGSTPTHTGASPTGSTLRVGSGTGAPSGTVTIPVDGVDHFFKAIVFNAGYTDSDMVTSGRYNLDVVDHGGGGGG
jgi:hypothetical protein